MSDFDADALLEAISKLKRIAHAVTSWQRKEGSGGFTMNQALALHHLVHHGDATPGQLADWMHVSRGSATPTIQRLEELGFLTRRTDTHDARMQWLVATDKARAAADTAQEEALYPIIGVFEEWPSEDLAAFDDLAERILQAPLFSS